MSRATRRSAVGPDAVSIATRLGRLGHVPGLVLHHLDFRVLLFLLGQPSGVARSAREACGAALARLVSRPE
jgi:hypothetical protein